jgi:hypothetical protein
MLRLAAAVLLTPIFVMIGAPTAPVKMATTTYNLDQEQAGHLRFQEQKMAEFSVGTAAYAAQYPMVSAQAMALITSH